MFIQFFFSVNVLCFSLQAPREQEQVSELWTEVLFCWMMWVLALRPQRDNVLQLFLVSTK